MNSLHQCILECILRSYHYFTRRTVPNLSNKICIKIKMSANERREVKVREVNIFCILQIGILSFLSGFEDGKKKQDEVW